MNPINLPYSHNHLRAGAPANNPFPANLATVIGEIELIQLVTEAVNTYYWSSRTHSAGGAHAAADRHPRLFLAVLIYSYAVGIFSPDQIALRTRSTAAIRFLVLNVRVDAARLRVFRGQNLEVLRRCLAFVVRHCAPGISPAGGIGPHVPVENRRDHLPDAAAGWKPFIVQAETDRRLKLALAEEEWMERSESHHGGSCRLADALTMV